MDLLPHSPMLFYLTAAPALPSTAELRWQLTAVAIGVVILSIGLAGLSIFFLRRKTGEWSLVLVSLFSLLYATRLISRQGFVQSLVPASHGFWSYSDMVIDCVIVIPLTLFLVETAERRWKTFFRWLLVFQIVLEGTRFLSFLLRFGRRPMGIAHGVAIVVLSALFPVYPLLIARGRRLPREFKVLYAGLVIFFLFVIHNNLIDFRVIRGRSVEPIGFLVFVCCLVYLAAHRSFAREERLLSIEKELEIARRIQSSILPRDVPLVRGLSIAARYVPMAAVAGDFYDFLVLDQRRIGILVADVTGHGVPAALIASMLKTAFVAQTAHAADPAKVLRGLNLSLCGKFEEHFVTAIYLFVDAEEQIFRYAGAGHPPLLLGSVDGGKAEAFHEVESNGLLLGISEEATYCALERPFRPGDRCVLYTDGIIEAKNAGQEEFGSTRFVRFLETQSHVAAASLVAALLSELTRWTGKAHGGAQEDDITLIAVDFERG